MRIKPLKWRMIAGFGRFANSVLHWVTAPLGKRRQTIAVSTILEHMEHVHEAVLPSGGTSKFFSPGYKPGFRGISILSKQPEVPLWIDDFQAGEVLWDVGANVGAYSLYAGLKPGVSVLAFEPEASNYYVLTRNVALNAMWDRIETYCMALSDKTSLEELSLFHMTIGGSKHAFGDPTESWEEDDQIGFQQGMISFSIDRLIKQFDFPFPNHTKIDVDGIEEKSIDGAHKTLSNARLKSVLIARQTHKPAEAEAMHQGLVAAGLSLSLDAGTNVI